MFHGFNEELLKLGLVSRQMYADSSLVKANVSGHRLSPSGMSVDEFKNKAVEENGLFVLRERRVDENGVESERVRYFQVPGAVRRSTRRTPMLVGARTRDTSVRTCITRRT